MPDQSRTPWITLLLVAINLAMAFLAVLAPGTVDKAIFDPIQIRIWAPLTCLFAHQNLLHLLANLIFLAAVGPLIEFTRGPARFLIIYIIGGLLGVLGHFAFAKLAPPGAPLLGASGSIAACVGYCSIRFARTKVPILPKLGVPVGAIAIIWLAIQAAGSVFQIGDQARGGVAFWAHLAGFLAGLAFAFIFGGLREARFEYGHEVLSKMNERGPAAILAAAEALLIQQPKNRHAQWQRIQALKNLHEDSKCRDLAVQFVNGASDTELIQVLEILGDLNALGQLTSVKRLQLSERLAPKSPVTAELLLLSITAEPSDARHPEAIHALVKLLATTEDVRLPRLVQELTMNYPDHPATKAAQQEGLIP